MVCLTILSHALIAQSRWLASAGAQILSHVARAPWMYCAGNEQIKMEGVCRTQTQTKVVFQACD